MITEAFEQSGAPVRLHVVGDGEQAMQFLHRAGGFADAPGPAWSCSTSTCRAAPAWRSWPP